MRFAPVVEQRSQSEQVDHLRGGAEDGCHRAQILGHRCVVFGDRLPDLGLLPLGVVLFAFRREVGHRIARARIPAALLAVATLTRVEEERHPGEDVGGLNWLPDLVPVIEPPRLSIFGDVLSELAHRHRAELVAPDVADALGRELAGLALFLGELSPEDAHVALVAGAEVAADVEVAAAEVGRGVEEPVEVAPSEEVLRRVGIELLALFRREAGLERFEALGRAVTVELVERLGRRLALGLAVGRRLRIFLRHFAEDDDRARLVDVARGASKALDEARPRRELGEEHLGGDVHARLDDLRRDDDAPRERHLGGQAFGEALAVLAAEAAVEEDELRPGIGRFDPLVFALGRVGLGELAEERQRLVHRVEHDERQRCASMLLADGFGQLGGVLRGGRGFIARLGRFGFLALLRFSLLAEGDAEVGSARQRLVDVPQPARALGAGNRVEAAGEVAGLFAKVGRLQPSGLERRAHPPTGRGAFERLSGSIRLPERRELNAGRQTHVHQLNLVEHPQRVIVQEPELDGPGGAARRVAAVERPREQHVLRADEDGRLLGREHPLAVGVAAEQDGEADLVRQAGFGQPALDRLFRLLDEHAHRQAEDEARGPGAVLPNGAVEEPGEDRSGRLSKTGWNADEAIAEAILVAKAQLPGVGRMFRHRAKK